MVIGNVPRSDRFVPSATGPRVCFQRCDPADIEYARASHRADPRRSQRRRLFLLSLPPLCKRRPTFLHTAGPNKPCRQSWTNLAPSCPFRGPAFRPCFGVAAVTLQTVARMPRRSSPSSREHSPRCAPFCSPPTTPKLIPPILLTSKPKSHEPPRSVYKANNNRNSAAQGKKHASRMTTFSCRENN